jgi:hypothetical protein
LAPSLKKLALAFVSLVLAACAPATETRYQVFNRTEVAIQLGFAEAIPACAERVISGPEMNDASKPLRQGAWRPRFTLSLPEIGSPEVVVLVVGMEKTDVLVSAPNQLPACEGQPAGWAPDGVP